MLTYEIGGIKVNQFTWNILDANTYAIEANDSALIIDVIDNEELFEFASGFKTLLVLLTHSHYDHICGLNKLRAICPETIVYASESCSANIQDPQKNLSNIANPLMAFHEHRNEVKCEVEPFSCRAAERSYTDKAEIMWEGHIIQMSEFKGHSADSSCILVDGKYLFSGDTILPIPTITRLPGGSSVKFWKEDITRLKALQKNIEIVFPGHKMPGKLEDMLLINERHINR